MLRKYLVALALVVGSVLPFAATTPPASAAPYCPTPTYCSTGVSGWLRYITCGPWMPNYPYWGYYCDRCYNCLN